VVKACLDALQGKAACIRLFLTSGARLRFIKSREVADSLIRRMVTKSAHEEI
jgi:hypothetical protein